MSAMSYAVFVNSTDFFEDCWHPFFELFSHYWPDCYAPVWLNTETKRYTHPKVAVSCTEVGKEFAKGKQCWSAALIDGLQKVEEPYVLYLQEDYFLNASVRADVINRFVEIMMQDKLPHIRLERDHGIPSPGSHPRHSDLCILPHEAGYYFCLQAGLWEREALLACLRPGEDAWTAERRGTRRARRLERTFYLASPHHYRGATSIFPYTMTGIVGGKWLAPAVVGLFASHGIEMDFSKRGFFNEAHLGSFKSRLRRFVRNIITRF